MAVDEKVKESPKSLQFIMRGARMSVPHFMIIIQLLRYLKTTNVSLVILYFYLKIFSFSLGVISLNISFSCFYNSMGGVCQEQHLRGSE